MCVDAIALEAMGSCPDAETYIRRYKLLLNIGFSFVVSVLIIRILMRMRMLLLTLLPVLIPMLVLRF